MRRLASMLDKSRKLSKLMLLALSDALILYVSFVDKSIITLLDNPVIADDLEEILDTLSRPLVSKVILALISIPCFLSSPSLPPFGS